MALPVDRFVDPQQDFEGLYRYSGRLEQNRLRQEQEKQAAAGRKAASDKYFANYLDPKERFTGTMADPVITDKLAKALDQAFELSAKGATDNEIFMAITPLVNEANEYTQKAKAIQAQKKQALEVLGKQKGIDPLKFSSEFDDEVFMETDPKTGVKKMRELSTVDPSQNYADAVLKNRDIYTPEGFDEYVAKAGKNTSLEDVSVYGKDKSMRRTKAEMTAPSFMISDKDERGAHVDFVPKYEIATDGDNVVMGEFMGQDGAKTKAPVRMVTNEVFNDLPVSAKAFLRQEVRRLAKEKGVDLNAAQSENLAKAIAYDELKNSGKQYSTLKEVQVQKAAPAPRITVNVNNGGDTQKVNDIYGRIDKEVQRLKDYGETKTPGNLLDADAQSVVLDFVNKGRGEGDKLLIEDIRITKSEKGELLVFDTEGNLKTTLPKVGTNLKVQPGVAEKRDVIKDGDKPTPKKDPLGIL